MKQVIEFIRRLEQGFTEAVLCRADDDKLYVVKTRLSGRETLVREWICGRIGIALGLPVPPIELVYFPTSNAQYSVYPEAETLSDCPGFASSFIEPADELTVAAVPDVDSTLRRLTLLFDWWVLNGDRSDGNPNLLWASHVPALHVIDHNLAFQRNIEADFWEFHIFRNDRRFFRDSAFTKRIKPVMADIISQLPQFWAELPVEWTDLCKLTLPEVESILRRCEADGFWES